MSRTSGRDQVHGRSARAVEHAVARRAGRREALGTEQAVIDTPAVVNHRSSDSGCGRASGEVVAIEQRRPAGSIRYGRVAVGVSVLDGEGPCGAGAWAGSHGGQAE